jgi:predicted transcriptional regulator
MAEKLYTGALTKLYTTHMFPIMPSATVRISPRGHRILSQLATESTKPMAEVLEEALEAFRRQKFLEQAAAAYETLAADGDGAKAYRKELESMEGTLGDGLDPRAG